MKELFQESVTGLNDLVRQQLTYVNEERIGERRCEISVSQSLKSLTVANLEQSIFLAGGFAANDYLCTELMTFARRYGIDVYRPEDG